MRLIQLVEQARERAIERCRAAIVEELVTAGVQFGQEYPDAPRV